MTPLTPDERERLAACATAKPTTSTVLVVYHTTECCTPLIIAAPEQDVARPVSDAPSTVPWPKCPDCNGPMNECCGACGEITCEHSWRTDPCGVGYKCAVSCRKGRVTMIPILSPLASKGIEEREKRLRRAVELLEMWSDFCTNVVQADLMDELDSLYQKTKTFLGPRVCMAPHPSGKYTCTEDEAHMGDHIARNEPNVILAQWPRDVR